MCTRTPAVLSLVYLARWQHDSYLPVRPDGKPDPLLRETHRSWSQVTAPTEVTEKVYTDTVAVLPGYARAVATELRAPSERWHQYQEPPTNYFDDAFGGLAYSMSPAVREAYQDESVLGRALKVLYHYTYARCDTACFMQPFLQYCLSIWAVMPSRSPALTLRPFRTPS